MMHLLRLSILAFLLWGSALSAQTVLTPATVIWDDPSPAASKPSSYTVTIELTIPATQDTPCTACVSLPLLLPAAGAYTLRLVGTNADGSSLPVTTWTEVVAINSVPPALSLIDNTGAVWTRSATSHVLRNGIWVATGDSVLYLPAKQRVYYHGPDQLWYEWHAPYWWTWGPTQPR